MPQTHKPEKKRTGSAFDIPEDAEQLPIELLAIDPGTRHCGMALFTNHTDDLVWVLKDTMDFSPILCVDFTQMWMNGLRAVQQCGMLVVEGYQLYPNMMQEQGMSRMGTPEVIGALKWVYLEARADGWDGRFMEQGASIKTAGRRYIEQEGKEETGSNTHKRDAEAHAWYRIKILRAEAAKLAREAANERG